MTSEISVCIPTYEQFGKGHLKLKQLFDSILMQDCVKKVEVCVSDNSAKENKGIQELVKEYEKKLTIKYFRNTKTFGVSNNTNAAIKMASTDMIKIMYQDDYFVHKAALSEFIAGLEKSHWCICDSNHVKDTGTIINKVTAKCDVKKLGSGVNPIGMPSVIGFKKTKLVFDNRLKTLLDIKFYLDLFNTYGEPHIINKVLVAQRIWDSSVSSIQSKEVKKDELKERVGASAIKGDAGAKKTNRPVDEGDKKPVVIEHLDAILVDHSQRLPMTLEQAKEFVKSSLPLWEISHEKDEENTIFSVTKGQETYYLSPIKLM